MHDARPMARARLSIFFVCVAEGWGRPLTKRHRWNNNKWAKWHSEEEQLRANEPLHNLSHSFLFYQCHSKRFEKTAHTSSNGTVNRFFALHAWRKKRIRWLPGTFEMGISHYSTCFAFSTFCRSKHMQIHCVRLFCGSSYTTGGMHVATPERNACDNEERPGVPITEHLALNTHPTGSWDNNKRITNLLC